MEKIWKRIPKYEEFYQISNSGEVKSFSRKVNNQTRQGRILKPYLQKEGYLKVVLTVNGISKSYFVHRLVALTFLGMSPINNATVNHKDGDKLNNNASNLEWISNAENLRHAHSIGKSTHRKIRLYNTQKEHRFDSIVEACRYFGKCDSYINSIICQNKNFVCSDGTTLFVELLN